LDEALGTEAIIANKAVDEVKALVEDREEEAQVESDSDNSDIE
jgi:hypothetical protein